MLSTERTSPKNVPLLSSLYVYNVHTLSCVVEILQSPLSTLLKLLKHISLQIDHLEDLSIWIVLNTFREMIQK